MLKRKNFNYAKKPRFENARQTDDEPQIDEEGDPNMDMGELLDDSEDEDLDEVIDQEGQNQIDEERQVIESKTELKDWILECERVSSKLKFSIQTSSKDWRQHIESSKKYNQMINNLVPSFRKNTERMNDDLSKNLDDLVKREQQINASFQDRGVEYKQQSEEFKRVQSRFNHLTNIVRDLSDQYRVVSDKLQVIKVPFLCRKRHKRVMWPIIRRWWRSRRRLNVSMKILKAWTWELVCWTSLLFKSGLRTIKAKAKKKETSRVTSIYTNDLFYIYFLIYNLSFYNVWYMQ